MDEGVEHDKGPDGRRREPQADPHREHCAGVVVGLERGGLAALGEDDGGVEHLVELGEVEVVAVEREAVFPDAVGEVAQRGPERVGASCGGREGRDGGAGDGEQRSVRGGDDAGAGPGGVGAEARVVGEDECAEEPCFGEGEGLWVVSAVAVCGVDEGCVGAGDDERRADVHDIWVPRAEECVCWGWREGDVGGHCEEGCCGHPCVGRDEVSR